MQFRPAAMRAYLSRRDPFVVQHLVWIAARNRASGAVETIGFWTGEDHREISVGGQTRTYYGAGGLLALEPISHAVGTDIRTVRATLAPMAPEVAMAVRGYDPRQAPVEVHRMLLNPTNYAIIGTPVRRLKGWIDRLELPVSDEGREARCELTIASNARAGTRTLALKKSDASQRLRRLPDGREDRFYRYTDITGAVPLKWGEE